MLSGRKSAFKETFFFLKIRTITACLCDDWDDPVESEQRCRKEKGKSVASCPSGGKGGGVGSSA